MVDEHGSLGGVLDWEFAAWSDPYEDLGWMCARCWRFGADDREAGGIGPREAFYRGYAQQSGTPVDDARVRYFEVMATVRWAVIALQQVGRFLDGGERTLELALTARIVPELEHDILDQAAP
jgi:aminoglycoside phosphotransferase (APT) family kinase protein